MNNLTESDSKYDNLHEMKVKSILEKINKEDSKVSNTVKKSIPDLKKLCDEIIIRLNSSGRLFYIGSGTSGRLGILDASECPPTFGVSHEKIIGIIAGGDSAIRKAVESAEDDENQAWIDLNKFNINKNDVVIGITSSGSTPYVVGGLKKCFENKIYTASIICNENMPISKYSKITISLLVGPEFITGSTRMKAGTAQKMVLNMISTTVMIRLGHIRGNKMIDMKINNSKLKKRGINIIMKELNICSNDAEELLTKHGSVRKAIDLNYDKKYKKI